MDFARQRQIMVERHIRARGVRDPRVLAAMAAVPREALVPPDLAEFAYRDSPLPIAEGQTISQPYIVAHMTEALRLRPTDRVLEIGTGSGYAAAVLAEVAGEVYTVERHAVLADSAREKLQALGYRNIHVRCGDGTLGWIEHAPYQGIVVAAGGPDLPDALLDQLAIGGRLVMPVGPSRLQELVRVTRKSRDEFEREDLGSVQFVPLIGQAGWADDPDRPFATPRGTIPPRNPGPLRAGRPSSRAPTVSRLVAECAAPIGRIDDAPLDSLLDRIGDARVVLLGEATHGTSEFYRMRARISRELVLRRGFTAIAVEADWPDAAVLDRHARHARTRPPRWTPFARFPTWMWRNEETAELIEWLRAYNGETRDPARQVSFSGLDLYSMYTSAYEVVRYLDAIDPAAAAVARERYGCLTPWQADPAVYGRAALTGRYRACETHVVGMLRDLLARRLEYMAEDGDDYFDAVQNARVVAGAEQYYRAMYYGSAASWNLRDQHMFDTLRALQHHRGQQTKVIVWAHNSHVGDAAATEMGTRGEHNIGHLCRTGFGDDAFLVGFGTDRGTVAAAHDWDGPMELMQVRPAHPDSYERLCGDAGVAAFQLALRDPVRDALRDELMDPRLERAIGVVYRPATELASHYFQAVLPVQFDEYIWFSETTAVAPLPVEPVDRPLARTDLFGT
ncbi:MAG TPA: protein-L-isoaspartate(D-aspartate) O-methyltransferase [Kofleriaceae bacterium]|nr:protein-L-isoaspartate(D-aspartate) O-methyltransferase [Kofleriaceae bacterium]